jgi:nitrogenase molybdenum-iron protein alpha/beta subunit
MRMARSMSLMIEGWMPSVGSSRISSFGPTATRHLGEEFEVPLIRLGFPLFDRHHLHRQTTMGYEGMMSVVTQLTNAVLEQLDKETIGMGTTDYNFDLVR